MNNVVKYINNQNKNTSQIMRLHPRTCSYEFHQKNYCQFILLMYFQFRYKIMFVGLQSVSLKGLFRLSSASSIFPFCSHLCTLLILHEAFQERMGWSHILQIYQEIKSSLMLVPQQKLDFTCSFYVFGNFALFFLCTPKSNLYMLLTSHIILNYYVIANK